MAIHNFPLPCGGGLRGWVKFLALAFASFAIINLNAIELSQLCQSGQSCTITTPQSEITNHNPFSTNNQQITIKSQITNFINYSNITATKIGCDNDDNTCGATNIANFYNYGYFSGHLTFRASSLTTNITNYGTMGGVNVNSIGSINKPIVVNNFGLITISDKETGGNAHFGSNTTLFLKNYAMIIDKNANSFNTGTTKDNSHLIAESSRVHFFDSASKLILDFGNAFEFGKEYDIDKLVTDTNGTNKLKVDFSRLTTRSSLYYLTQNGKYFIVNINAANSEIGTLYKSNIRTMNNFTTISDSMIYPHKYKSTNRSVRKRVIRRVRKTASLFDSIDSPSLVSGDSFDSPSLAEGDLGGGFNTQNNSPTQFSNNKSTHPLAPSAREGEVLDSFSARDRESILLLKQNESFAYKSNSLLLANLQEQRQRRMRNSTQNLNTRSTNQINNPNANKSNLTNRTTITNQTINRSIQNDKYYFILTPFANHNYFFESGRYNLSGLEYGFVSAFSGKLNNTNSLGIHFVFSYGSLKDKDDLIFNITSMNLNMGLNYKLDLIWDMYVKARIDGYYFLNEVKSKSIKDSIKPNTIGFGASVSYGKDFNFGNAGILGLSGGIDYKGLYANDWTMSNMAVSSVYEKYNKQLYNLLYLDLSVDYSKYFNTSVGLWGLNTKAGIKGNVTNNALAKSKVFLSNGKSVDMLIENDMVLGYANIAGSYVLQSKDFDMEFSLAFYGNYGNRVISNGGGFEWRVWW